MGLKSPAECGRKVYIANMKMRKTADSIILFFWMKIEGKKEAGQCCF